MWLLVLAFVIQNGPPASSQRQEAAAVFAQVPRDRAIDDATKQDSTTSLGCDGGDQSVRYLEGALRDASPEKRQSIARALGHTRSRLAVPVLIGMFRDDSARDEVCDALLTLTHRTWCDVGDDDVALRKAWRRWWSQMKSRVEIYESDSCRDTSEHRESVWNW